MTIVNTYTLTQDDFLALNISLVEIRHCLYQLNNMLY